VVPEFEVLQVPFPTIVLPKQMPFRQIGRTRRSARIQNFLRSKFFPIFGS
jgi:hypothetical protein